MKLINPFKPTAGMIPPVLIGRKTALDDFVDGIDEGPGSPSRLMRITGPRGSGKTVLLTELGEIARQRGWLVIDTTSDENIQDSIVRQLVKQPSFPVTSVKASVPFLSAEATFNQPLAKDDFRETLERSVQDLTDKNKGLLITLDEAQNVNREQMRRIASCVQLLIRKRQNIAFAFAGITTGVLDLLNDDSLTFLRRAKSEELRSIPLDEVSGALRATIERSGLEIEDAALDYATKATAGYAYLTQLVGYHVWRAGRQHAESSPRITLQDAEQGVRQARQDFDNAVLETALAGLSKPAIDYLLAMTAAKGASPTREIAERMGKPAADANTYRRILISRQIIEATAPGYVAFSIPFMRDYLVNNRHAILARYGVDESQGL